MIALSSKFPFFKSQKSSPVNWYYAPVTDVPVYPKSGFENNVKEAHQKNVIIFKCFDLIFKSIFEAPLVGIKESDGEMLPPEHKLNEFLRRPAGYRIPTRVFWYRVMMNYYFGGNAFLDKVRNGANRVIELTPLRSDRVKIIASKPDYILGYEYQVGCETYTLPREDVVHHYYPNVLDDYYGLPYIYSAFRDIDISNEITDLKKVLLQNKGISPGTIVSVKGELSEDQQKRLIQQFKNRFGGDGRGGIAVIGAEGTDIKSISMNMDELGMESLNDVDEATLCALMGVPPILVGLNVGLKRSTYSNYEQAHEEFYQGTIQPLQTELATMLNEGVIPDMGLNGRFKCKFDITNVAAFSSIRKSKREESRQAYKTGIITLNEARREHGYQDITDGDTLKPAGGSPFTFEPKSLKSQILLKEDPLDQLVESGILRITTAEKAYRTIKAIAKAEFIEQSEDIDQVITEVSTRKMSQSDFNEVLNKIESLGQEWVQRLQEASLPVFEQILHRAGVTAGKDIDIEFDLSSEEIQAFIREYNFKFAHKVSQTTADQVRSIFDEVYREGLSFAEINERLKETYSGWTKHRTEMIARTEVIRSANSGAEKAYMMSPDIEQKQWLTVQGGGDESTLCGYCEKLDRKIVTLGTPFLKIGDVLDSDRENEKPYTISYDDIQVPPAHPHCRCAIIPVISLKQLNREIQHKMDHLATNLYRRHTNAA